MSVSCCAVCALRPCSLPSGCWTWEGFGCGSSSTWVRYQRPAPHRAIIAIALVLPRRGGRTQSRTQHESHRMHDLTAHARNASWILAGGQLPLYLCRCIHSLSKLTANHCTHIPTPQGIQRPISRSPSTLHDSPRRYKSVCSSSCSSRRAYCVRPISRSREPTFQLCCSTIWWHAVPARASSAAEVQAHANDSSTRSPFSKILVDPFAARFVRA